MGSPIGGPAPVDGLGGREKCKEIPEETAVPIVTNALAMPQTPSEWLLARYDRATRRTFGPQGDRRGIRRDRGSNFDRRMFDLLDDHPSAECPMDTAEGCPHTAGAASWPVAPLGEDISGGPLFEWFADIA